jgi:hypothetical protein
MRAIGIVGLLALVAFAGVGGMLDAGRAQAEHIPGATYTGTHSGGGSISFTLPDASGADGELTVTQIPCDGQTLASITAQFESADIDASVEPHSFVLANPGGQGLTVNGTFPSSGSAEGTFEVQLGGPPELPPGLSACSSGVLTWTATTAAPAPPPATATPPPPPPPTGCPAGSECIPLTAGVCQFETWTGMDGTSPADLAAAVRPGANLSGLWAQQPAPVWKGFNPAFPEVSDMEPVNQLDVVAICMSAAGDFVRPMI